MAPSERAEAMTAPATDPFVSYADPGAPVNWSEELEAVHAEASRTHFLDRWTRQAVINGIGPLPHQATIADLGCSTGFLLEDLHAAPSRCRPDRRGHDRRGAAQGARSGP